MRKAIRKQSEFPGYRPGRKPLPWAWSTEAYIRSYFLGKGFVPSTYQIGKKEVVA